MQRKILRNIEKWNIFFQYFQMRAHIYQARSLIGSDASGLSDPFARWTRYTYFEDYSLKNFLSVKLIPNIWQRLCQMKRMSILSRLFKHILSVKYICNIRQSLCQVNQISIRKPFKNIRSLNQISKQHLKHIWWTRSERKTLKDMYLVTDPNV